MLFTPEEIATLGKQVSVQSEKSTTEIDTSKQGAAEEKLEPIFGKEPSTNDKDGAGNSAET